jgi:esterase/lipase superfamily enzyme
MPRVKRHIFGWHSQRTHMHMPIVRYGDWGRALLLFPTAGADFLEYERFYLIDAIRPHIESGKCQVFSIDSINRHAWMNHQVPLHEKAWRQAAYMGYIEEEVLPHIRLCLQNPSARIGVAGASFGAFHAANATFRRPDLFDTLIAMSGFYDLEPYLHGHWSNEAYFNNPMWYVDKMPDGRQLEMLRHHTQIHLLTGRGSYEQPHLTGRFSDLLWRKGIWHNADYWGHDVPHDWPTWRKMLDHYVGGRLGW